MFQGCVAIRWFLLSSRTMFIGSPPSARDLGAWLLTVNQVPAAVVGWLQGLHLAPWTILLAINVVLLVVGCFFDPLSAILVASPLLVPVAQAAAVDTVHFGTS